MNHGAKNTCCGLAARWGGGGVLDISLGGKVGPAPHTLTLFKENIDDFPTLFKTEFRFLIPYLRHLKLRIQVVWLSCCVISGNSMCLVSIPKSTEVSKSL